jgi:hypothetical protein
MVICTESWIHANDSDGRWCFVFIRELFIEVSKHSFLILSGLINFKQELAS